MSTSDDFFKYSKEYRDEQREAQRKHQLNTIYVMWRFLKWLEGGMTYEQIDTAVINGELIPDFNILRTATNDPCSAPTATNDQQPKSITA